MIKFTFDDIKEKIIDYFIGNGEKKIEGMIYYDNSIRSYLWAKDLRSIVLAVEYNNISDIKYFKMTKRNGLEIN